MIGNGPGNWGRCIAVFFYACYELLMKCVLCPPQIGLTNKNYAEMNELYSKHAERGLEILAFPCNQFGSQVSIHYLH